MVRAALTPGQIASVGVALAAHGITIQSIATSTESTDNQSAGAADTIAFAAPADALPVVLADAISAARAAGLGGTFTTLPNAPAPE